MYKVHSKEEKLCLLVKCVATVIFLDVTYVIQDNEDNKYALARNTTEELDLQIHYYKDTVLSIDASKAILDIARSINIAKTAWNNHKKDGEK